MILKVARKDMKEMTRMVRLIVLCVHLMILVDLKGGRGTTSAVRKAQSDKTQAGLAYSDLHQVSLDKEKIMKLEDKQNERNKVKNLLA